MNNYQKGKKLENKTAERLDAVGIKNNNNGESKALRSHGFDSERSSLFPNGPGD
ncbi:9058_t:CDS:2, partial [Funneliformis mosseae]